MKPEITDIPSACRYLLAALEQGFLPCQEALRLVSRDGHRQYCSVGYLFTDEELDRISPTSHAKEHRSPIDEETGGDTSELLAHNLLPADHEMIDFLNDLMAVNDECSQDQMRQELQSFLVNKLDALT